MTLSAVVVSACAAASLLAPSSPCAAPASPLAPQDPKPVAEAPVYDEQADAKAVVTAALARAAKDNKRVLIQWGANWCGWCKWLAATMQKDAKLSQKLRYEYEVVHVDVGRFDKNKDLAERLGAAFKSIPYLTILAADGKAVVQQNTEPFETKIDGKSGHDAQKLLDWLTEHQAKPLDARAVLAQALSTAKEQHKRLFLHFGAPWCGWCHRLEAWLEQPEVAVLMAKDFHCVKIDNDRMTSGKEVYRQQLAAAGVREGGIPWFVILEGDGRLLAHSNGPAGNIGFPYQPDEVAHFAAILAQVKVHLTAADITALRESLDRNRQPK